MLSEATSVFWDNKHKCSSWKLLVNKILPLKLIWSFFVLWLSKLGTGWIFSCCEIWKEFKEKEPPANLAPMSLISKAICPNKPLNNYILCNYVKDLSPKEVISIYHQQCERLKNPWLNHWWHEDLTIDGIHPTKQTSVAFSIFILASSKAILSHLCIGILIFCLHVQSKSNNPRERNCGTSRGLREV